MSMTSSPPAGDPVCCRGTVAGPPRPPGLLRARRPRARVRAMAALRSRIHGADELDEIPAGTTRWPASEPAVPSVCRRCLATPAPATVQNVQSGPGGIPVGGDGPAIAVPRLAGFGRFGRCAEGETRHAPLAVPGGQCPPWPTEDQTPPVPKTVQT